MVDAASAVRRVREIKGIVVRVMLVTVASLAIGAVTARTAAANDDRPGFRCSDDNSGCEPGSFMFCVVHCSGPTCNCSQNGQT
jgi:hypothetical protein